MIGFGREKRELCTSPYPPLLHHFLLTQFCSPGVVATSMIALWGGDEELYRFPPFGPLSALFLISSEARDVSRDVSRVVEARGGAQRERSPEENVAVSVERNPPATQNNKR